MRYKDVLANLLTAPADKELDQSKVDWLLKHPDRLVEETAAFNDMSPARVSVKEERERLAKWGPDDCERIKQLGNRIVPFTSLDEICTELESEGWTSAPQRKLVAKLTPAILADMFERSVLKFALYNNIHDKLPNVRKPTDRKNSDRSTGRLGARFTDQLAADLAAGGPSRCQVERRPELDFEFIAYELPLARSHGSAVFRGYPGVAGFPTLDALFVNVNDDDRLPIIGEVKVDDDKNPFAALLQMMRYAAQICTVPQLQRLIRTYEEQGFRIPVDGPYVDLYMVQVEYDEKKYPYRKPTSFAVEMLEQARELARGLLDDPRFSQYVRRVEFLKTRMDTPFEYGELKAEPR